MIEANAGNQNLKTMLVAQSPEQFDALKQATMYYRLVRSLRATGWINLFLGGLTFWLGTSVNHPNIFSNIQAILGALIIAQSLWAISRPGLKGFLALMSLLLFCGLWNLFLTFYGGVRGLDIFLGLLGIYQLWGVYQTYKSYLVFSGLSIPKPTSEIACQYDTIWEGLAHPSPTLSPELMMMQLTRNRNWWNGVLLTENAILAHKRQKVLLVVSKPELIIAPENPNAIHRDKFAIFAQIGKESLTGKIYRSGFQQYLNWKGLTDPESEVDDTIARKRLTRKIIWWVMVAILALIALYVAAMVSFAMKYA